MINFPYSTKMPTAMFIGESSSLTFLVWKLSMKKDWEITVVLEDDSTLLMNADRQLTFHFGPNSFSVRPKLLASSLSDTLVGNIDSSFDYVFLSPMVGYDFSTYLSKIKRIVTRDTIILLDSCLFGERIVARVNCKYVSLIHSEIDCRKISSRKYYLNTNSKSFDFYVGRGCRGRKNNVMKELHAVYQSLEIGRWEFVSFLKINSLIFGKAVNLICIESLSLIFEQPNLLELGGNNSIALPMMKGLFQELSILLSLYKDKSGKNYINPLKLDLEGFILKEDSLRRQRQEIDKQSELGINFLDSPKMFYDFVQNFEIEIIPIISLLLDIADSVMFYTPVLESLLIFLSRLITIRDGEGELFRFMGKEKSKTIPYRLKNGITPEDNMMNFPPFKPLPKATEPELYNKSGESINFQTNPIVFMTGVLINEQPTNNEDEEYESLQELVRGTESLCYPDKFYDCEEANVGGEEVNNVQGDGGEYLKNEAAQTESAPDIPLGIPIYDHIFYANGTAFDGSVSAPLGIPLSNGGIYFPPPTSANAQYPKVSKNKLPSFYRKSIPITKNSSTKQLYESHTHLMESVQFNSFLEKSTSGRYGDVDTSITILNSANNSSKGSTPSRGSSKVELLKKESKDEKD